MLSTYRTVWCTTILNCPIPTAKLQFTCLLLLTKNKKVLPTLFIVHLRVILHIVPFIHITKIGFREKSAYDFYKIATIARRVAAKGV